MAPGIPTERVAEAICNAQNRSEYMWHNCTDRLKDDYLRMAQAAIEALELKPERDRHRTCVCRHGEIDHDMYGDGKCGANMVSRYTPCPCTHWEPRHRVRLVSGWVLVEGEQ